MNEIRLITSERWKLRNVMKKKLTVLFLCAAVLLFFAACNGNTVAKVNGVKISKDDYQQYTSYMVAYYESMYSSYGIEFTMTDDMAKSLQSSSIDALVNMEEIKQACDKVNCSPTKDEITDYVYQSLGVSDEEGYNEAISNIKSQYGMDKDMTVNVISTGLYQQNLEDYLEKKQIITFTADQAKELYEKDPESYDNRTVSYILIQPSTDGATTDESGATVYTDEALAAARSKAEKVIKKLDGGADFAEMAKKYSDDSSTASSGGAISKSFTKSSSSYVEEFTTAAFNLTKTGEYTEKPVKSSYGYFIIKCDALQDADNDYDALIKAIAKDNLDKLKSDAFNTYITKFDKKADVVYYYGEKAESETNGSVTESE